MMELPPKFIKVENVKRPLQIGEMFLVPCLVKKDIYDKIIITPVINHLYNDKENGQTEYHYHVDYRFVKHFGQKPFPIVKNNHSKHVFVSNIRPQRSRDGNLEYVVLPVINADFAGVTPVHNISKSKLKHAGIHKGKCPHRGYDLSQVPAKDGQIRCPLHGLIFGEKTGKCLTRKFDPIQIQKDKDKKAQKNNF